MTGKKRVLKKICHKNMRHSSPLFLWWWWWDLLSLFPHTSHVTSPHPSIPISKSYGWYIRIIYLYTAHTWNKNIFFSTEALFFQYNQQKWIDFKCLCRIPSSYPSPHHQKYCFYQKNITLFCFKARHVNLYKKQKKYTYFSRVHVVRKSFRFGRG